MKQKILTVTGLVACATAVLVASLGGSLVGVATAQNRGYAFDHLRVTREADPGRPEHARIHFAPRWAGQEYPGTRACTWTVTDSRGNVLGQATSNLTSIGATSDDIYTDMDIPRGTSPQNVSVSCGDRLDDPSGSYAISGISVSQPSLTYGSDLDVFFDYQWNGSGLPTPQNCDIAINDSSGNTLFTSNRGFFGAGTEPRTSSFSVEAPPEAKDRLSEASSAAISCAPVEGG